MWPCTKDFKECFLFMFHHKSILIPSELIFLNKNLEILLLSLPAYCLMNLQGCFGKAISRPQQITKCCSSPFMKSAMQFIHLNMTESKTKFNEFKSIFTWKLFPMFIFGNTTCICLYIIQIYYILKITYLHIDFYIFIYIRQFKEISDFTPLCVE